MTAGGRPPIRVLIADDHGVMRYGLAAVLGAEPDIEVVGEAADGAEALRKCETLRPDVVLMDVTMEGMDGLEATRRLTAAGGAGAPRVLVLTMHDEEEFLIPLLEAGARGYLVKSAAGRDLLSAVREVAAGAVYVRSAAARVLAEGWARRGRKSEARERWEALSEREQAVVRLFAMGYTPAQIGEQLFISPKTVDTYRRRVGEKTGLSDRAGYVQFALELGLLAPPGEGA